MGFLGAVKKRCMDASLSGVWGMAENPRLGNRCDHPLNPLPWPRKGKGFYFGGHPRSPVKRRPLCNPPFQSSRIGRETRGKVKEYVAYT